MSAVAAGVETRARDVRSEGVWHAAWRRFRADRVGTGAAIVVVAFLALIAASALGLVADDWETEAGVPNAPPHFLGPRAFVAPSVIATPAGRNARPHFAGPCRRN